MILSLKCNQILYCFIFIVQLRFNWTILSFDAHCIFSNAMVPELLLLAVELEEDSGEMVVRLQ